MTRSPSVVRQTVEQSSSPDPLANSSESGNTLHSITRPKRRLSSPRKTPLGSRNANSQMPLSSPAYASLAPNSPSKAVTEQTLSPWKIRVTVEAEPEDGNGVPQFSTKTYQVPIKPCSSPTESKGVRGRSKPAQSSPARKKRSSTPIRQGRGRRKSVTDLNITVLGDDEDENEWSPKKKSPAKGRGRKTRGSSTSRKPGRACQQSTPSPEENEDMEMGGSPPPMRTSNSPEIRQIDPDCVSVRPRSQSTKQKQTEPSEELAPQHAETSSPEQPSQQTESRKGPPQQHAETSSPEQPLQKTRNVSNTSAVSYPTPSPTPSAPADDDESYGEDEGVGYDTIIESEGFSMIDHQSIPSVRRFLSTPQEYGEELNALREQEPRWPTAPVTTVDSSSSIQKPVPIPIRVTPDADETELSSNVASSPPEANNLLQAQAQRPSSLRKVTPDVYASPKLPPPLSQSKPATSPEADTLPPRRVVNAGKALYGALASPEADDPTTDRTPTPGPEDFLDGFSSGTKRELRAGLRFGEELAKTQSSFVSSNSKSYAFAPGSHEMPQVWRAHHSPVEVELPSQTTHIHNAHGSSSKLSQSPLSHVQSEPSEQLDNPGFKKSKTPPSKIVKSNGSLETSRDRRLEHEWQVEREATSRQINEATPSRIVVINSSDDEALVHGKDTRGGVEQGKRRAKKTIAQQGEAPTESTEAPRDFEKGVLRKHTNRLEPNSRSGREAVETTQKAVEAGSASHGSRPRTSATNSAPLQSENGHSIGLENAKFAGSVDTEGDVPNESDQGFVGEDETDIWLLEAQDSSSSPRESTVHPRDMRTKHDRPQQAADNQDKPKRKLIPSPWKRGEDLAEASTMLSNGDVSGLFWQQPQETKFGAGALARQGKRLSSGGFDLNRMRSSPVKLATVGRKNLRLRGEWDSSSSSGPSEPSLSEESVRSLQRVEPTELATDTVRRRSLPRIEPDELTNESVQSLPRAGLDESTNSSYMPSSPPQPRTIPVNFNDSVSGINDVTPPILTRPLTSDGDESHPPTPRSALKGGRLGTSSGKDLVSPVKHVVFNERSRYLNELGEESTMSANLDSPPPEPPQPYRAPAPAEPSSEDILQDQTPKAEQKSGGWKAWLWRGKIESSSSSSGSLSEPASETSSKLEDDSIVSSEREADAKDYSNGSIGDEANWTATKTAIPASQQPRTATRVSGAGPKPSKARLPKLPSYLQPPSYPSLPASDPAHSPRPLATSGEFTNAHFRTLHILYAKSLRPRFHAPKHVRPEVQALRGFQVEVDETEAGMDVFQWTAGVEECLVLERFMQEIEWGHVQHWHQGQAVEVLKARWATMVKQNGDEVDVEQREDVYAKEMQKIGWGWSPEELARRLGMVVIGEAVRREEKERA